MWLKLMCILLLLGAVSVNVLGEIPETLISFASHFDISVWYRRLGRKPKAHPNDKSNKKSLHEAEDPKVSIPSINKCES